MIASMPVRPLNVVRRRLRLTFPAVGMRGLRHLLAPHFVLPPSDCNAKLAQRWRVDASPNNNRSGLACVAFSHPLRRLLRISIQVLKKARPEGCAGGHRLLCRLVCLLCRVLCHVQQTLYVLFPINRFLWCADVSFLIGDFLQSRTRS